jgi:hypothetical protein
MNEDRKPNEDFEDRLLAELRARVAARETEAEAVSTLPSRRHVPRLAVAGVAVTAVAAAVLIVGAGGSETPAAFAVTPHGDGRVSVEVRALTDAQGLERALDAAGVPAEVAYPSEGETCDLSRLHAAGAESVEAVPAEAVPVETVPAEAAEAAPAKVSRLTIDPSKVGDGRTLVLVATPAPDGEGDAVEATVAESGAAVCGATSAPAETSPPEAGVRTEPGVPADAGLAAPAEPVAPTEAAR